MAPLTNPLFYRWCEAMRQRGPQMPEDVFEVYYAALETGRGVSRDEIAEALHCDAREAAHWQAVAAVWLLDPRLYAPLFDAEDALADCRAKRTAWQANVKETEEAVERLDQDIATRKAYGLLSEAHAAEMADALAALEHQREVTLRHQTRDLPAMQQMLEAEECAVQARLWAAQAAIDEAFSQQVDAVQQAWLTEALERTEPVLEVLRRARTLDEAAEVLGRHAPLSGSLAVHQAVVHRLQRQG